MSEQKFYIRKDVECECQKTEQKGCYCCLGSGIVENEFIEATPEDFEKAGLVKLEKVKTRKCKIGEHLLYDFECCNCSNVLAGNEKYCPGCGWELSSIP